MARIDLAVVRGPHAPAASVGQQLTAIRLIAHIGVATSTGWSLFEQAMIDTGAPVSVLPPGIWRQSRYTSLGRVKIGGIARSEACRIPAMLAELECALSDGQRSLGPLRMYAYLAEPENAPALIGILGFIERGVLRLDLSKNRASLRMP